MRSPYVGENVHLPCGGNETVGSSVDWRYTPQYNAKSHLIIAGGYLVKDEFDGRLNLAGSTLVIRNLQANDSGIYDCVKDAGLGEKYTTRLSVRGKICESFLCLHINVNSGSSCKMINGDIS